MNIKDQINLIKRGIVDLISQDQLEDKLKKDKPLKIKAGFDPSAPDLHLGHTVLLRKLKHFQELGHQVYFLIGDFTARIGDPSGRSETRKQLTEKEVKQNAKTYKNQIFKILDPKKTKVVFNSKWCKSMKFEHVLELTSKYTIARLLERDDFTKRINENKPISILEILYPLIQAYDSFVLDADVEVGGTDQKFNMLVARDIQKAYGQPPQVIITMPILEGLDGTQKMSKSLDNYIAIQDSGKEIFGKIMSIPDKLMKKYFQLLTDYPIQDIKDMHPKKAKMLLAKEIVTQYYSVDVAEKEALEFDSIFKHKKLPEDITVVNISKDILDDGKIDIIKLLRELNLVESNSQARRFIQQKAVSIDSRKIQAEDEEIIPASGMVVKVGKLKFAKIDIT